MECSGRYCVCRRDAVAGLVMALALAAGIEVATLLPYLARP